MLSGELYELVQPLKTICAGIDFRSTVCDELQPTARRGNFGDVCELGMRKELIMKRSIRTIECPCPDNSDTICFHVSESVGNVLIGIEEGQPISVGPDKSKRAAEREKGRVWVSFRKKT